MIILRPYQIEARDAAIAMMNQSPHPSASKMYEWGARRQAALLAMATGSGKTEVFLSVIDKLFASGAIKRVMIVSHTGKLVMQPVQRILSSWPALPAPGAVKAKQNAFKSQIISACLPTIARAERLKQILDYAPIDFLIHDECHRGRSPSMEFVFSECYKANPGMMALGPSATPARSDRFGIGEIYGPEPAYKVSLRDAIFKLKCVTNFDAYVVKLVEDEQSFSEVRTDSLGNYAPVAAGEILSLESSLSTVVAKWESVASDRPTLHFATSVDHAHAAASAFRSAGYAAVAVDGSTPEHERERIYAASEAGEIQIISNCALLIEGADFPWISCAILSPTKHDGRWLQCAGRAIRFWNKAKGWADPMGNKKAILIDTAPGDVRDLVLGSSIMDAPPPEESESPREVAKAQGIIADPFPFFGPEQVLLVLRDMFAASPLAWFSDGRVHSVPIGVDDAGQSLALAVIQNGDFEVLRLKLPKFVRNSAGRWDRMPGGAVRLGKFETFAEASDAASEYADAHGQSTLNEKERRWRDKEPTARQIKLLKRKGVVDSLEMPMFSRGEVSTYINHAECLDAVAALTKRGVISID